jgi:hypothetical protein
MPKICEYQNCRNRAVYGLVRVLPIRCKQHKEDMKHVSSICKCGKAIPSFNNPCETIAICCTSCKTNTMIDIKNKKCKCGKSPHYNEPNEIKPICCASCKTDTMIDVSNKKCKCGKYTQFNEPGELIPICCSLCKTNTMVDVKHKKCNCGKNNPRFNEPGKIGSICCSLCKTDTMINNSDKKCKCGTSQPSFNEPGKIGSICCSLCKTDTMVNVSHKLCKCNKSQPTFNVPYEKKAICCALCKTDIMVDVRNRNNKCHGNELTGCPYNSKGNIKYKGYCTECFRREFPLDSLTFQIKCKTKEIAVRDFINSLFNGFQHDKILETSHCDCTIRRRIDHRKLIGNTLLAIETDENSHKSYNAMDEETRYDDLYMAYSGKWIYIRFNPDKYKDKTGKIRNPTISTRLELLKIEIEKQMKRIEHEENSELVERIYLFYDGYN